MHEIRNLINNEWVGTASYIDSVNPSTGKVHAHVPDSTAAEVDSAVEAADAAFAAWSKTSVQTRSELLLRIADCIEARLEEFAAAESDDQGKPRWLARTVDIPRACYNFRFFAGVILHQQERSSHSDAVPSVNYTQHVPVGVAGLISPWNLPLYLLTWKIAPCLAFGNTCVAKPSEVTSLTAFLLGSCMVDAGLPPGVCNLVFGLGASCGGPLVAHPRVPLVSFTGGTVTGKRISEAAAPLMKKLSLELGGKNPAIVFGDVDVDEVVAGIVRSSYTNQGEICLCSSRVYVHESIYDEFLAKYVAGVRALKVGSPMDADTRLGPLVSKEHLAKVQGYVRAAVEQGGTVECGFSVEPEADLLAALPDDMKQGFFMRPTIITGLADDSTCVQEEIFGPVVCVLKFSSQEEVIARANGVAYGLSAVIWSKDGSVAQSVARRMEAGMVWINCWMVRDLGLPFGGVKASGTGREGADSSREFFSEVKTIHYKYE